MSESSPRAEPSTVKKIAFIAIGVGLLLVLVEVLTASALYYSFKGEISSPQESALSTVNALRLAGEELGLAGTASFQKFRRESEPDPFQREDPVLGYSAIPGEYRHVYFHRRKPNANWRKLKVKVTMNEDGTRWTGDTGDAASPTIYVFGDSFVFGSGVNDEHTFSYGVQQALPDYNVRLFALGGYSLSQAYLRFEHLRESIRPYDVIVLGYGDFYDNRHVVAPSRLRSSAAWKRKHGTKITSFNLPKITLAEGGGINVSYVQENCEINQSYCNQSDPSQNEKVRTSVALINHVAANTDADVYLLHFQGHPKNPVLRSISKEVRVISALPGTFDSFIRDDIEGFDPHPGPYWHHAISQRLIEALSDRNTTVLFRRTVNTDDDCGDRAGGAEGCSN